VDCPDEVKFEVVRKIAAAFKQSHRVIDVDGARVLFDTGWGLIRASNTQPALVLRAEAKTPEALDGIKQTLEQALRKMPQVGAINW
jgi:phosphomannomutase/phosphoglucomutase